MKIELLNMFLVIILGIMFLIASVLFTWNKKYPENNSFISLYHGNAIRGIAILVILLGHIGNFSGVRYFTPLGRIGVSVFLILSGYGLYQSYKAKGLNDFVKKRFRRVIFPYWILLFFLNSLYLLFKKSVGVSELFSELLFLRVPNAGYWFVQYIILWYMIFYLIFKLTSNQFIAIILLIIASFFSLLFLKNSLMVEQSFSFILGVMVAINERRIYKYLSNSKKVLLLTITSLFIGCLLLGIKQIHEVRLLDGTITYSLIQQGISLFSAISIILATSGIIPMKYQSVSFCFGKYSYEIYLVHISLLLLFKLNQPFYIQTLLFLLLSLISTLLFIKLNELMHVHRLTPLLTTKRG